MLCNPLDLLPSPHPIFPLVVPHWAEPQLSSESLPVNQGFPQPGPTRAQRSRRQGCRSLGSASRGYVALSSAIWHRLSGSAHPESQRSVQSRFCPRRFRLQRASKPILVPGIPWIHESGTCDGSHRLSLSLSPRRRFSSSMSVLDARRLCHCGRTARALGADIMEPSGISTPRRVQRCLQYFFFPLRQSDFYPSCRHQ